MIKLIYCIHPVSGHARCKHAVIKMAELVKNKNDVTDYVNGVYAYDVEHRRLCGKWKFTEDKTSKIYGCEPAFERKDPCPIVNWKKLKGMLK